MLSKISRSRVLASVLLIVVASGVCWAVTVNINPHKIVLNAQGESDDVHANVSIYLPGAPVVGFDVTLSFDESEDGVVDDDEVIAEAESAFYCVLDNILIVGFDRTELQKTLEDCGLVNTTVRLTVEGSVTVKDVNGNEITKDFSGTDMVEIVAPGQTMKNRLNAYNLDGAIDEVDYDDLKLSADATLDAGVDMITWSGEPVQLDPTILITGDILWTSDDPDDPNISFDPAVNPADPNTSDVEDPTVTITGSSALTEITVPDASFETRVLPDTNFVWLYSSLSPDWRFADPDGTAFTSPDGKGDWGYIFIWNPGPGDEGKFANWQADGFGGNAADGENCAYVGSRTYMDLDQPCGLAQLLEDEPYDPDLAYRLTVRVGRTVWRDWGGYKVELLAGGTEEISSDQYSDKVVGGTVIGQDISTETPEVEVWGTSTVNVAPNPGSPLAGLPLQVRFTSLEIPGDPNTTYIVVDDVRLYAGNPDLPHVVTLTLDVAGEQDTMQIYVYDTQCDASIAAGATPPAADLDGDCIVNLKDFAEMAVEWLAGSDLAELAQMAEEWLEDVNIDGPVAKP